ncbi:MAG: hypothetical protein NTX61_00005 [Bacteroidetes bacterium]|nr:hypothetical protein [Bacteroidota bacterium]
MKIQIFKYIKAILLSATVLYGTTGITFMMHTCTSEQKTEINLYPSSSGSNGTCCCGENIPAAIVTGNDKDLSVDQPECCTIRHSFLKTVVFSSPEAFKFQVSTIVHLVLNTRDLYKINDQDEVGKSLILNDPSPPLYGVKLVHFLNQSKIPVPVC